MRHDFEIPVSFRHRVVFGRDLFAVGRPELAGLLREGGGRRVLVFLEGGGGGGPSEGLSGADRSLLCGPGVRFPRD